MQAPWLHGFAACYGYRLVMHSFMNQNQPVPDGVSRLEMLHS